MLWFLNEQDDPVPAATNDWLFAGNVPTGWTLTRDGSAMGHDSAGRWTTFAANTPRPYRVPLSTGGTLLGTLVEPERTQLVFKSTAPQYVTVQATSVSDNTIQTPVGLGVLKLAPNNTSAFHGFDFAFDTPRAATIPDGSTASVHLIFKMVGAYQYASFFLLSRSGVFKNVLVNAAGIGSIISHSVTSASITSTTDGFLSLKIVCDYGIGTTTPTFNMSFATNSTGDRTFVGDGTSHMQVAYLGAEIGTEVTSPIVSNGLIAVVRPADVLSSDPTWLRPVGKSLAIQYTPLGKVQQTIVHAAGADSLELRDSLSALSYTALVNGSNQASINGSVAIPSADRTVVVTAGTDEFRLINDGVVVGIDEQGIPPQNVTSMRLGALVTGASAGPIVLHRVKYWETAINQTAAIAFSDDLSLAGDIRVLPVLSIQPTRTVDTSEDTVTFVVTLDGETAGARVGYRTIDGSAIADVDYVPSSGTIIVGPGQSSGSVTIGLRTRTSFVDKAFKLELIAPVDCVIGNGVCVVTIRHIDPPSTVPTTQMQFETSLPSQWTLVRSTPAWKRANNGIWTSSSANTYRQHYTSPGVSGLLIEATSAEQRLYDSVDPGWTAIASTKTVTTVNPSSTSDLSSEFSTEFENVQVTVPTGTRYVAWRETTATGEHILSLVLTSANADTPTGEFTTWLLIKPVTRAAIRLRVKGIDNVWGMVRFNLTGSGSVTYQDSSIITYIEADLFMAGWYKIGMNRSQGASAGVNAEIELATEDSTGSSSFSGSTSAGFEISHVQVEVGAGTSSPIIVQGASAKTLRDRDVIKAASSDSWYKIASYSLGMQFIRLRDQPTTQRIWMAKDVAGGVNGMSTVNGVLTIDDLSNTPLTVMAPTADGSQTTWTLPLTSTDMPRSVVVPVDGTVQTSGSYGLSGTQLTLLEAPPESSQFEARVFGDGSRTVWNLPWIMTGGVSSLLVFVDGVLQPTSSYSVSSNQVSFSQAPRLNSVIDVRLIGY